MNNKSNNISQKKEEHEDNISIHKTKYQLYNVPKSIVIGEYTYVFKDKLKSEPNFYTYRCQKYSCRIPININNNNLDKLQDKDNKEDIKYIIKKEHTCKKDINIITETPDKCSTEDDIIKKAKDIIKLNPLKPLSFQKIKLNENNIFLEDNKINRIINQIRNNIYPIDNEYLNIINSITITFDDKLPKARNIPYCPVYNKFLNPSKKWKLEKYIILTSIFQLLFLTKATNIFIDATFKVAPKNFYQVYYNVIGINK